MNKAARCDSEFSTRTKRRAAQQARKQDSGTTGPRSTAEMMVERRGASTISAL